jgi:hypothetical protein
MALQYEAQHKLVTPHIAMHDVPTAPPGEDTLAHLKHIQQNNDKNDTKW